MTGFGLIIVFIFLVIFMIFMMSKLNIHAFLALLITSIALGLFSAGLPLVDTTVDGETVQGLSTIIASGFAGTMQSIGLVIIFGTMIGTILELTGGAFKLADMVIKVVGEKRPVLGIMMMGWVVSLVVFVIPGYVVLDPVRKALVKKTRISGVAAAIALSLGLYTSHTFIPPTPGPIAAANTLYEGAGLPVNLLMIMGLGALISIPCLIGSYLFSNYIGKKVKSKEDLDVNTITQSYEEIIASFGKLPGIFSSVMIILIPLFLIGLGSFGEMQGWTGTGGDLVTFFGTPFIAIGIGVICGVIQIWRVGKLNKFHELCNNTLKIAGPIAFLVASSGILGTVIVSTDIVDYISANVGTLTAIGIFLPFILAAIIKTAQGSTTVSMITTSGIVAPMLGILGLNTSVGVALCVMSIGSGALIASHANDAQFWAVMEGTGMTPAQGYKTQTLGTLVQGLCSIVGVFILSLILL
jgi:GntP family gluconate:H+ symporter